MLENVLSFLFYFFSQILYNESNKVEAAHVQLVWKSEASIATWELGSYPFCSEFIIIIVKSCLLRARALLNKGKLEISFP